MTRFKLSKPGQPLWIRWSLRLYEFAASLGLAVTLIFLLAGALGLATFIEAAYGAPVVQFYVYQAWWFTLLLVLLAVNIFCAAAIRYPWKRHQTGFVITHIGLLLLLLGAYLGRNQGIDAQVAVFEGEMSKWAIENAVDLQLTVNKLGDDGKTTSERVEIPFHPGLFNWNEWSDQFAWNKSGDDEIAPGNRTQWQLFRSFCGQLFSFSGQHGAGDVLYNRNGIKLEVVDFLSDSRAVSAPHLKLNISMPTQTRLDADGKEKAKATTWIPVELSVRSLPDFPEYPFGLAQKQSRGGGTLTLQLGGSAAQTQSFLKSLPEGSLGKQGQVAIFAGGEVTRFLVEEKLEKGRFKLAGDRNIEAEVVEFMPAATPMEAGTKLKWQNDKTEMQPLNPAVKIMLYEGDKPAREMVLVALEPFFSMQDHAGQVYGEYWFDHSSLSREEREKNSITSRLDFFASHDGQLFYRYWDRANNKVQFARELDPQGTPETAVEGFTMPIGQVKLYVSQFIPSETPQVVPVPHPFIKGRLIGEPSVDGRMPAAKLRLTVDDKSEEFWLFPHTSTPDSAPKNSVNGPRRIQLMEGKQGRVAALTMPIKSIDIGFRVRLAKFERKLDPGTDQPSHFASWVDFVDRDADRALFALRAGQGSALPLVLPAMQRPTAIAIDSVHDYVYWIDSKAKEIRRAKVSDLQRDPELASVDIVVREGLHKPRALAVDGEGQRLYWSDGVPSGRDEVGLIRAADTDGGKVTNVAQMRKAPEALVVAPEGKHLYFAGHGVNAIGRTSLDGSEMEEKWFVGAGAKGVRPVALTLTSDAKQLYWAEAGRPAIRRVKLDGTGEALVLSRKEGVEVLALAFDPRDDRLFFTESYPNEAVTAEGLPTSKSRAWRLISATAQGSDDAIVYDKSIDEPQGLALAKDGTAFWSQTTSTRTDVWITMNAPVDCFDPQTGRSYRLFQESFSGPFKPGDGIFEEIVDPGSTKDELFRSVLTVNYDSGRGLRNIGCLLVCVGIGVMFYMRAYFFKSKGRLVKTEVPQTAKV